MMKSTKVLLKPCPFCGSGDLDVVVIPDPEYGTDFVIECQGCHAGVLKSVHIGDPFPTLQGLVELWNTRPGEDDVPESVTEINLEKPEASWDGEYYGEDC